VVTIVSWNWHAFSVRHLRGRGEGVPIRLSAYLSPELRNGFQRQLLPPLKPVAGINLYTR
jgi:hypothetical protein